MRDKNDNFDKFVGLLMYGKIDTAIKEVVIKNKNTGKYENKSHFIRVACINELKLNGINIKNDEEQKWH